MQLGEIIRHNIALSKYEKPTPVQKYAIPAVLSKRDVMACAQTGMSTLVAFLFDKSVSYSNRFCGMIFRSVNLGCVFI